MGYRHTLISSSYFIEWPEWFKAKYDADFYITEVVIATKGEKKFYIREDFFTDTQVALNEIGWFEKGLLCFVFVALSEDNVVNKIIISKDNIKFSIAGEFYESDDLDYYGA